MTIAQAATYLDISQRTVRRWIQSGKLHADMVDGQWCVNLESDNEPEGRQLVTTLSGQIVKLQEQLETKDKQIERLQSSLDQAQTLHAMSQQKHDADRLLLSEFQSRTFLQRLRASFSASQ